MGVRSTLASFLSAPATRLLERELRELVEDVIASRSLAPAADLEALRAEVERASRPEPTQPDPRVAALEAEVESLKKKLGMAMGAVQASTAQLMQVGRQAEEARGAAGQAMQQATTARSTAESAVDALGDLEDRLGKLERGGAALEAAPLVVADSAPDAAAEGAACRVPGCEGPHRARGFCAKHYQQFRRNTLDGFVGPDGIVPVGGRSWQLDPRLAGQTATWDGARVLVAGAPVEARPAT